MPDERAYHHTIRRDLERLFAHCPAAIRGSPLASKIATQLYNSEFPPAPREIWSGVLMHRQIASPYAAPKVLVYSLVLQSDNSAENLTNQCRVNQSRPVSRKCNYKQFPRSPPVIADWSIRHVSYGALPRVVCRGVTLCFFDLILRPISVQPPARPTFGHWTLPLEDSPPPPPPA